MTPPPQRFPPGDRGPEPIPFPPGDRAPTKSLGPLQGMGQPGISKADAGKQGTKTGEKGKKGKKNTPEQDAVIQIAKEAKKKGGLTPAEAEALKQLGKSAGLDAKDHTNTTHWKGGPHIHVGPVDHIPVR